MTTATITLPVDIKRMAETRAAAAGFEDADEYVAALILAGAGEPVSEELEAHLLKALQKPGRLMSSADWDAKRRRLEQLHREGKL